MNGTMSEAYTIRSDTTYHPVIHTIYLTGNWIRFRGSRVSCHRGKLRQALSPYRTIPVTIPNPDYDPVLYANPAYRPLRRLANIWSLRTRTHSPDFLRSSRAKSCA